MTIVCSTVVTTIVAACNPALWDDDGVAADCSRSGVGDMFSGRDWLPAVDEGNGIVSQKETSWNDTLTGGETFQLKNCQSGESVTISDSRANFVDVKTGAVSRKLTRTFELVDTFRRNQTLNDLSRLAQFVRASDVDRVRESNDPETLSCACELYYPNEVAQ